MQQANTPILSTAYFAPVQYFTKFFMTNRVLIEAYENYNKQSYRNRCNILGPNGVQSLSVPILKGRSKEIPITDIRIDYSESWQENHLRSIRTAYHSAPFYEHYIEDIASVLNEKEDSLLYMNTKLTNCITELLEIGTKLEYTSEYHHRTKYADFRNAIHPKKQMQEPDPAWQAKTYYQVFNDRMPFVANLSILDLLFNEGPRSIIVLKDCLKT